MKFTGATTGGNSTLTDDGSLVSTTVSVRADGIVYWGSAGVRTETRNDAGLAGASARSGFYETSTPAPAASWYPNASDWQHMFEVRHTNPGNNYALQLGGSFFDQDLWFRKTNNNGSQSWSQLIGAGERLCTAPFNFRGATVTATVGGIVRKNTICATTWMAPATFNNAQNICYAIGGHLPTYNEMYRLLQVYGFAGTLNGDWIGQRATDDDAYCVNNTSNLSNFEGQCDKNDSHWYLCVNSSTVNQ